MRPSSWHSFGALALVLAVAGGCDDDDAHVVRGRGLEVATLSPASQARVYEAAIHGAFEVDESLSMLLDARQLPRGAGLSAEGRVAPAVASELSRGGVIRGTCEPPLHGAPGVPLCAAARPGYIVRFSPVFALREDSVQVYAYFRNYDIAGIERSQTLRFERAYQVVKHDGTWRAVREAHVPKELRDEPR